MDKKFYIFVTFLAILTMLTPACTRSASQSPIATITAAAALNFPVGTQPAAIPEILTQTAAAASLPKAVTPGIKTPDIKVVTLKPTKKPTHTEEAPTETPGRPHTYTLQYGEWPVCIARRYNLDIDDFFARNHISMRSRLLVGAELYIPQHSTWDFNYGSRYWHKHPAKYTVQPGDNIYTVACFFGDIGPDAIRDANGLGDSFTLHVGQVLTIP
jgi:hypothetical protein